MRQVRPAIRAGLLPQRSPSMRSTRLPTGERYVCTTYLQSGTYPRTPAAILRRLGPIVGLCFILLAGTSPARGQTSLAGEEENPTTRWTMLHVQGQIGQADCHLITLPDGRHVLIDAGEGSDRRGAVLAQLRRAGVTHLALAIMSHFHRDHYGQLIEILEAGISIERVIVNVPVRRVADREVPWGCDYDDVLATLAALTARGIPFHTPHAGERLIESCLETGPIAGLDVVCAYDGVNTPVGETDVNDTSIIVRLFHGSTRVLYTGDLNHALGAYLAASGADIRADILKAPHHGTEGCAPNDFYDGVSPSAVLVPSPTGLWLSQRSSRTRTFFAERGIPTFVNGLHGNVDVVLGDGRYSIQSEIGGVVITTHLRPEFSVQPVSATAGIGSSVTLSVVASGLPTPEIQWMKNGEPISGATGTTLRLRDVEMGDAASYTAVATNPHGRIESVPATLSITAAPAAPRSMNIVNLSARGWAEAGELQLIGGFVVRGQGSKTLLVRAVGPSLGAFGVSHPLADPQLVVTTPYGRIISGNDNWGHAESEDLVRAARDSGAFALSPGSLDAAMCISLPSGAYTALISGRGDTGGVVLFELYDLEPDSTAYLVNLSARSWVAGGGTPLILGFTMQGTATRQVLCRAVGPSLGRFGIGSPLSTPRLDLHAMVGGRGIPLPFSPPNLADRRSAELSTGAFAIASESSDPVALLDLDMGIRTQVIGSADGQSGVALAEVYLVP